MGLVTGSRGSSLDGLDGVTTGEQMTVAGLAKVGPVLGRALWNRCICSFVGPKGTMFGTLWTGSTKRCTELYKIMIQK